MSLKFLEYVASGDKVQMDPDETEAVSLNFFWSVITSLSGLTLTYTPCLLPVKTSYKLTHYNPLLHMNNFKILQCVR